MLAPLPYLGQMRSLQLALLMVLAVGIGALPTASAQTVNAPPGASGIDEYLETVPGAKGPERPARESLDDPKLAAKARRVLGAKALRDLKRAGKDGRRAAELAAAGARDEGTRVRLGDPPSSSGATGGIVDVLTGGAGAGWVLPAGLIAITIVLAAAGLWRRRRVA